MFKEWLKQFLCVILCIVTLLSPITAYAGDYVESDSDDGVTYYIIEGKDVKSLFDFGIDKIPDILDWLFNFKSYTVVKNYTNLDGENTYKVYFNTPNLQSIVKNEVTGLISDGYTDNTYNVDDTQWLIDVGKDDDGKDVKVNAITKYGFDIPNYRYQGEYPKEVMTAAGIVPSPKKWWEVLWAAIKALFGGSFLKSPDADNFNSIKYNNHTYTVKEDYLIEYIRRYYIPYLENKMISGSAADYDEDEKKWSDGSKYFDGPEEVMELTVSEDAYDAAKDYNDKYEDIYDDAIQHYVYWKYYESKNKTTVGIGSDWWDDYKRSLSGYTEDESYLAELKELGIFSGDNDKIDEIFYQDEWLKADGPKIKLNKELYGYSNPYTVYDPIWFFASREIYKQNFKKWLDTDKANREAAIVMLNSIDDSNKKSVLAIGGPTYSDASTYGLTSSKFTATDDLYNVVDIAATLIKYAEDSIWVKIKYDIQEKRTTTKYEKSSADYDYYTNIDKITFKLYKHDENGNFLDKDGNRVSKDKAEYVEKSFSNIQLDDYFKVRTSQVDNKLYNSYYIIDGSNGYGRQNFWYTRTTTDPDESGCTYVTKTDRNGNTTKVTGTENGNTIYYVQEKVTKYELTYNGDAKKDNTEDTDYHVASVSDPVITNIGTQEESRKYTDVSSWIENPTNHTESVDGYPKNDPPTNEKTDTVNNEDNTPNAINIPEIDFDTVASNALLHTPITITENGKYTFANSLADSSISLIYYNNNVQVNNLEDANKIVYYYDGKEYNSNQIDYYISGNVTPHEIVTGSITSYTVDYIEQSKINFKEKYVWDNEHDTVTTTVKAFRDWEKAYNLNKYNYQYTLKGKKQSFTIDDIVHPDLQAIYTNYNKNKELIKKYKKFSKYMNRGWYWEESNWKKDGCYEPYEKNYKIKKIQQIPYKQCMLYVEDPDKEGAECKSTEYSEEETTITLANVIVYSGAYKITAKYREAGETEMTVGDAHTLLTELQLYCGPYYTDVLANIVKLIAATANYDGDDGPTSMIVDDDPRSMPYDVGTLVLPDKDNYTVVDPRVSIYKDSTIGKLVSDLSLEIIIRFHLEPTIIGICGKITEFSVFLQSIMSFDVLDDLGLSPADMWNHSYIAIAIMVLVIYFIIKTVKAVIKMGEKSLGSVIAGFLILILELGLCAVLANNPEGTWTTIKDFNARVMSFGEMATIKNDGNLDYLFDSDDDFATIYYLPYLDTWSKYNTGYGLLAKEQLIDGSNSAELEKFTNPQLNGNDIKHWSVLLADSFEYHGANDTYLALYEDGKFINGENINNNAYRVVDHFMAPRVKVTPSGSKVYLSFSENENYNGDFQNGFGAMMVKLLNCLLGCYLSLIQCMIFIFFWWQFYIFVFRIVLGLSAERKKMSDVIKETFVPLIALVLFSTLSAIFITIGMDAEGFFGAVLICFMIWLAMVVMHWWYTKEYRYFPFTLKWVYYFTPFGRRARMRKDNRLLDDEDLDENGEDTSDDIEKQFEKYFDANGNIKMSVKEQLTKGGYEAEQERRKIQQLYIKYRNYTDPGQNTSYKPSARVKNAIDTLKRNDANLEIGKDINKIDLIMEKDDNGNINRNVRSIINTLDSDEYKGKSIDEIKATRKKTKEDQQKEKEKKEQEEKAKQEAEARAKAKAQKEKEEKEKEEDPNSQHVDKPDTSEEKDKNKNRKIGKKKKRNNPDDSDGPKKIERK